MRRLVVSTFMTLDGVMQAPGGPGENDSGGFELGGWSVNYWDEMMAQVMGESTSQPFAMVLGRRTYDVMAANWRRAREEDAAEAGRTGTLRVPALSVASEVACKPSSVPRERGDGHPSTMPVARHLLRPTRKRGDAPLCGLRRTGPPIWPCTR